MPSALFNVSVRRHIKCAAFTPQLSGLDNGKWDQVSMEGLMTPCFAQETLRYPSEFGVRPL